eukprot:TRINITY_DN15474_c1_g1_i1.p1 TRINITY_DN15474_c1_g1~~TRINITY_DN15474_c1_g1_i1.p1  ORF type:complete len:858 (-),score=139.44 TRINITY_DN15474_c1_g1_i1:209-2782(-)
MLKTGVRPDLDIFETLFLLFQSHLQEVNFYVDSMKKLGLVPNSFIFDKLFQIYSRHNDLRNFKSVYDWMVKACERPSHFTLSVLLRSCPDLKLTEFLFLDIRTRWKSRCNTALFNLMMKVYIFANEREMCDSLYQLMLEGRMMPNKETYGILFSVLREQVHMVESYLKDMETFGILPESFHYTQAIKIYGNFDKMRAKELYDTMVARQIQPDCITLSTMIKLFVSDIEMVEVFLKDMNLFGLKPNQEILNTLMLAYVEAGNREKVLAIYNTMKEDSSIRPSFLTFAYIFLIVPESVKDIDFYLEEMEKFELKPTVDIYCKILNLCYRLEGGLLKGRSIYDRLVAEGIWPNHLVFVNLLRICLCHKDVELADHFFDEMLSRWKLRAQPTVKLMIKIYKKANVVFDRFVLIYRRMVDEGMVPELWFFSYVLRTVSNDVKISNYFLQEMSQLGLQPSRLDYYHLMSGYCSSGHRREAFLIYQRMRKEGIVPPASVYHILFNLLPEQDQNVDYYLEEMSRLNVRATVGHYNVLICNFMSIGLKSLDIYHRMVYDGVTPDVTTFNLLYQVPSMLEHFEYLLEEMTCRWGLKPTHVMFQGMMKRCALAKDTEKGLRIYNKMKKEGIRPSNLTFDILLVLFSDLPTSIDVLESLLKDVVTLGVSELGPVFAHAVSLYYNNSNNTHQSLKEIYEMKPTSPSLPFMNSLILGFSCELMMAEQVFEDIETYGLRPDLSSFHALLQCYRQKGRGMLGRASMIYQRMLSYEIAPDHTIFETLFQICYFDVGSVVFFFREMLKFGLKPSLGIYNVLLRIFQQHFNDSVTVKALYIRMLEDGLEPDSNTLDLMRGDFFFPKVKLRIPPQSK